MKKVLVVEDNKSNMYLISFMLKQNGFKVIEAWTWKEGIDLAIKEKPDFILMDIQLPDIDGLETTRRIRDSEASGKIPKIPIIALTSSTMVGDREKAFAAGCTGYIEKPINPHTFLTEIKKYV